MRQRPMNCLRMIVKETYCSQGWMRSPYHSGKRVDLRTHAFIDMRRWKRPDQPLPSTSITYLYCRRIDGDGSAGCSGKKRVQRV